MSGEESRQHPRFRVALRVHFALATGTVSTNTTGVSRMGMSVRLSPQPALEEEVAVTIELPSGTSIDGRARCKSHMPGALCGMSLSFGGSAQAYWDSFVDEEESTGSLWRMIGRIAQNPDDAMAPRGVHERDGTEELRFHTAGENGEAYRVAFEKCTSDVGVDCDLASTLPGFKEQARRLVNRVLREPMTLRLDEAHGGKLVMARIAELQRGGYAYVQGDAETPTGLVALCVGELILVARNGKTVFPHFTDDELERVACDTFRRDLGRPVFAHTPPRGIPRPAIPAPIALPPVQRDKKVVPAKFREGLDAVRFAQAAADDVQVRRYGDRDVFFHPSVWARVKVEGSELMGPTLHDGVRVCVLALVGPGAPRVVRLDEQSAVSLLKPPAKK
jgi:hypothetical protein